MTADAQYTSLVEALAYADAGYELGPVTVRQTPRGGKSCTFHTAWQKAGGTSRDPEQLFAWDRQFSGCGFHAPCRPNGIVVVDLDGEDGVQNWQRLGGPTSPMTVMTRSGGRHLYFRAPAVPIRNSAGAIAPHVDARGDGGTVFISGTVVHGSDARYVATRILAPHELPKLSDEWATRLREAGPKTVPKRPRRSTRALGMRPPERGGSPVRLKHSAVWIEAKARNALRQLGREGAVQFPERLYIAALAGYRAVAAGVLDETEVDVALADGMLRARGRLIASDVQRIDTARRDVAAQPWEVTA